MESKKFKIPAPRNKIPPPSLFPDSKDIDIINPMTDKNKIINRAEPRLKPGNLEKFKLPAPRDKIYPTPESLSSSSVSELSSPSVSGLSSPSVSELSSPSNNEPKMESHIVLVSKDGKANIVYINTGENKYAKYTKNGENYNDDKKAYNIKLEESFSGGKKTKRNRKKKTRAKTNRKR